MDKKERNRIRAKIRRDERQRAGLCVTCGQENDRKPKPQCSVCVQKHNERAKRWAINCILDLKCPTCGKDMEKPHWKCPECHQKVVDDMRLIRARKRADNICYHCPNPVEEGKALCPKCLNKRRNKKDNEQKS